MDSFRNGVKSVQSLVDVPGQRSGRLARQSAEPRSDVGARALTDVQGDSIQNPRLAKRTSLGATIKCPCTKITVIPMWRMLCGSMGQ